jgi:ABC-type lipoprotein release transport system permease subunit
MILLVAWRNIWRNKLRSMVMILAIAIGVFASVFTWAFYRGMVVQRIETAIEAESSHIQIHHPDYLEGPDQRFFIPALDKVAERTGEVPGVKAVTRRVLVHAMISSAENGAGVRVIGIHPGPEGRVTTTSARIVEGSYFQHDRIPLVLGAKLAEKLSVKLRSRVVITLQTMDDTLTSALFRVEGIYRTSNSMFDEMNVFVRCTDLCRLINLDPHAGHELAVLLDSHEQLESTVGVLRKSFPGLDVRTWRELMPEVSIVEESMDLTMYIFIGVVLLALISGIINTMLMAVLERLKELGMLMAIGMNRRRVFTMILLETVMLSLTGGSIGILAGYVVTVFFNRKGIDLSNFAEATEKLGYAATVYPATDLGIDLKVTVMVLITAILAALYPAWKAIRLRPAETLRLDV